MDRQKTRRSDAHGLLLTVQQLDVSLGAGLVVKIETRPVLHKEALAPRALAARSGPLFQPTAQVQRLFAPPLRPHFSLSLAQHTNLLGTDSVRCVCGAIGRERCIQTKGGKAFDEKVHGAGKERDALFDVLCVCANVCACI